MKKVKLLLPVLFLIPAGVFAQGISRDMMYSSEYTTEVPLRVEKTIENISSDITSKTSALKENYSPIEDTESLKAYLYALLSPSPVQTANECGNTLTTEAESILKQNLGEKLLGMRGKTYTLSSLRDPILSLRMGKFNGTEGREGWPYTISFQIGSQTLYQSTGYLLYTEITAKPVPRAPTPFTPDYDSRLKSYNLYLDTVDVFEGLFSKGKNFIDGTLSYTAEPSPDSSRYTVRISRVEFTNVLTGRTVKALSCNETGNYFSEVPLTVDLVLPQQDRKSVRNDRERLSGERVPVGFHDSPKPEKEAECKTKKVELSTNDKMDTYSALLYCLPGTISFYDGKDESFSTLGYSLTYGFTNHFYGGLNLEAVFFREDHQLFNNRAGGHTSEGSESGEEEGEISKNYFRVEWDSAYSTDFYEDSPFVLTGVLGFNWNIGKNFRMAAYGEAGLIFNDPVIGSGVSLEYLTPSRNLSISTAYTWYIGSDDDFYNKFSIGLRKLF